MIYDWEKDSKRCWLENLHWQRIIRGFGTFKSPLEMYIVESWGMIP
jgi:hypothetical protein